MKNMMKILLIVIMLIGLAGCASLRSAAVPTWPIPEGVKTIEVNGYPMAYREAGSGIPLVLLHMHPGDYRSWVRPQPAPGLKHASLQARRDGDGCEEKQQKHK
jgi:uncharacterized protein YceK